MTKLTAKEAAFAQAIVAGKTQADSYRGAYSTKAKPEVIAVAANRVANRARVIHRITELRNLAAKPSLLTRTRKLEKLAAMVETVMASKQQLTPDQLKALEIDNKMQGHNEAEKIKVSGLGGLLQKIRASSPKP